MKTSFRSYFVFPLTAAAGLVFGTVLRAEDVVRNPPGGGLPDGILAPAGTQTTFESIPLDVGLVPEPGAAALLAIGILPFAFRRRAAR